VRALQDTPNRELPIARLHHQPPIPTTGDARRDTSCASRCRPQSTTCRASEHASPATTTAAATAARTTTATAAEPEQQQWGSIRASDRRTADGSASSSRSPTRHGWQQTPQCRWLVRLLREAPKGRRIVSRSAPLATLLLPLPKRLLREQPLRSMAYQRSRLGYICRLRCICQRTSTLEQADCIVPQYPALRVPDHSRGLCCHLIILSVSLTM